MAPDQLGGNEPPEAQIDGFEAAAGARLAKESPSGQPTDEAAFAASFNLFRVSTRILHHLEAEVHRPLGLSLAGFRVLFVVWVFGPLEPREIARLSGVSRAAVSSALNTLERDGLAERTRDRADRRLVTVELTPEGTDLLNRAYSAQHRMERAVFGALDREQLATFTSVLRQLMEVPLPTAELLEGSDHSET